jgi:hypothetical protein
MPLPIRDGNQSLTTLSTILVSNSHIPAHTVVSFGAQGITDIATAVSGVELGPNTLNALENITVTLGQVTITGGLTDAQLRASAVTIGGSVTATISGTASVTFGTSVITGSASILNFPSTQTVTFGQAPVTFSTAVITGSTSVLNFPTTQTVTFGTAVVTGSTSILNFPATQTVTFSQASVTFGTAVITGSTSIIGTSSVTFTTATITGSTSILNFPASQTVTFSQASVTFGTAVITGSTSIIGTPSVTFSQASVTFGQSTITGSVSILNLPATQTVTFTTASVTFGTAVITGSTSILGTATITGSTSILNFPATQPVSIASVTIGNSVTIGSLPAISGTVTIGSGTAQIGSVIAGLAGWQFLGQRNFFDDGSLWIFDRSIISSYSSIAISYGNGNSGSLEAVFTPDDGQDNDVFWTSPDGARTNIINSGSGFLMTTALPAALVIRVVSSPLASMVAHLYGKKDSTLALTNTQLRASALTVSGNINVSNTVTIAGTVTANPTGTQTIAGTVTANGGDFAGISGTTPPAKIVPIGYIDTIGTGNLVRVGTDGGQALPTRISETYIEGVGYRNLPIWMDGNASPNVPISGTVTVGNSVTIGSLPAISGTVSLGIQQSDDEDANIKFIPIGYATVDGDGQLSQWTSVDSLSPLPVYFPANYPIPAGTAQIGVVTIGGGTVTIGAGTAQIGSVTVGNSVTIASLPAISGTVTANAGTGTFIISDRGTTGESTVSSFTSTSSAVLKASNSNRKLLTVFNEGNGTIFILLGSGTASTTNYSLRLLSGDYYELEKYTGEVNAIFAAAGTAKITEIT